MLKIVYSLSAVMYIRLSFLNIDIAFFLTVTDSEVITSLINKKGVFDSNSRRDLTSEKKSTMYEDSVALTWS